MSHVECEQLDEVLIIRLNRPERLNAMGAQLMTELAHAWCDFRDDPKYQVAILTGTAGAFCVGEDLKESAERGGTGFADDLPFDPFWNNGAGPATTIAKPIISAVNGWAMGGGFIYAWMSDLRVASRNAVFEISEARVFTLGAYEFGFTDYLPWTVATELALGFRLSAERAHQIGFVNRLVDQESDVVPEALAMADHLLSLPPDSLRNTLDLARRLRPAVPPDVVAQAKDWRAQPVHPDAIEARQAFLEKRRPRFTSR